MPEAKPRRAVDPELQALARLDRILSELDERATERVIMWLNLKYGPWPMRLHVQEQAEPVEAKE